MDRDSDIDPDGKKNGQEETQIAELNGRCIESTDILTIDDVPDDKIDDFDRKKKLCSCGIWIMRILYHN